MIVYDLSCTRRHVFEAWFGASGDFDDQRARGLLSCPLCGDAEVTKAAMAPAVPAKGNRRAARPQPMARVPDQAPEQAKAMLKALAVAQARLLERSDWVGDRFAREARAIHEGDADERPIHGQATRAEARALIEDGVSVAPLPLPVRPPSRDN